MWGKLWVFSSITYPGYYIFFFDISIDLKRRGRPDMSISDQYAGVRQAQLSAFHNKGLTQKIIAYINNPAVLKSRNLNTGVKTSNFALSPTISEKANIYTLMSSGSEFEISPPFILA